ncbi:MAG: 30S ribosomal protein S21 [Firmicutes bacterium]|nr:30S ribosomal protein S21 [Bacillota bacterium]
MSEIRVGKDENLEQALRRFKKTVAKEGILAESKRHSHYDPPSVKRKKKSEAARRRHR